MLKKFRHMLKKEEGFTLMELMIAVAIIGILAGIAVPTYRGMQDRAKLAVGQANAQMLNRAITMLETLGMYDADDDKFVEWEFDGTDNDKINELLGYVELGEVEYVVWESDKYVADLDGSIPTSEETTP